MNSRFPVVLCPTDLSPEGTRALAVAYRLVADGGTVHLLHVIEPAADDGEKPTEAEIRRRLSDLPTAAGPRRVRTRGHVLASADVAGTIEAQARRYGADVVVMSTRGRTGLSRLLMGSVASDVVRKSDLPVILVRSAFVTEPNQAQTASERARTS